MLSSAFRNRSLRAGVVVSEIVSLVSLQLRSPGAWYDDACLVTETKKLESFSYFSRQASGSC